MIEYENLRNSNNIFYEEWKKEFNAILDSGWYILGNKVKEFEKNFAAYCATKYCCGVANGLDALILSLRAFNFEKSSEVIVPSNTYIATILSIIHSGLKPVLVEPDLATYNIDPAMIEEGISSETRAILVVHLYGKLCDMVRIKSIARKHNLVVIEDCAQSHGASYNGKKAGSFGDVSAFSFYPTKNLGAIGDGGSITTDNDNVFRKISSLRNYGSSRKYYNEEVGYNSRLDEIQAGFLNIKLKSLDIINDHKRMLAKIYRDNLKKDFILPVEQPGYYDVYHIFNIRHERRDKLKEYMELHQVGTDIHYPVSPVKQVAMKGIIDNFQTPIAEEIHKTTLSLPISFGHTSEDVLRVIEVMNKF